jgi:PIF1-like helicase/Helix-turn-helix domain/HRDC domain/Helicase
MNYDTNNEMFQLAVELVNQSSRNIFLTGKAGTGKTTFLKYIKENCHKQMAVVAPTGVAAINAGGVTMHSFFQLPFGPFIPDAGGGFRNNNEEISNRNSLISRLKMTGEKKKIIRELELLIIDEISMVRCDMLDAVDTILRHIRRRHHEKFGGLQVLFIGDMFQLPPVIKEAEWSYLKEYYNSPFFFDSVVIKEEPPLYIEFTKIYRQSEEKFINLLNQVRNNELDDDGRELLESRFQPVYRRTKNDGYIILTTHNEKARGTNIKELANLGTTLFSYTAEITGEFPESAYPADELLQLRAGAQVMFIKNDSEKAKRYFNGKIGVITEIDNEKIIVQCDDDDIEVKKEKWENIRYTMNSSTRRLEEEVLGSFVQYPLRLAWAITIHKSQGLTFEKAIIDAGEAFAPGQVYVALSRCTALDGIVLQSRIKSNSFFTDDRIVRFSQNISSANLLQRELQESRRNYQLKVLLSLFDYQSIIGEINELKNYLSLHKSSFNESAAEWIAEISDKSNEIYTTAEKFQAQLKKIFVMEEAPESNIALHGRIKAGSTYFINEQNKLLDLIQRSPVITDSRIHAKEFNDGLKEIFTQLSRNKYMLDGFSGKFEMEIYHRRKKHFTTPSFNVNAYAGIAKQKTESPHPVLHQKLRKMRDSICSQRDLPIYIVAGTNTLDEMARYLPQSLEELRKISGFGDAKIEKYGQQFLDIILEYSKENNLASHIHEKIPKRERKSSSREKKAKIDTKAESFRLYKEGKRVNEISKERNLTQQTIEGHLAHYILQGDIDINELVSRDKIVLIEQAAKNFSGSSITPIKEKLGSNVSFGEIRMVLAWLEYLKNQRPI